MQVQGGVTKMENKKENFSEWYNEIIETAGLCDKRYPVKGMNVWTPYGWKAMTLIDRHIRNEMDATDHQEVCFPLLISEEQFAKEAKHIKGFGDEVFWVTHGGESELDVKLLLRPTSETAMYPMFSLWVRSHSDLPLKTYQIVNTFRYETRQTRAFIRVREIHFFEAHTCHRDFEDAERQIQEDLEIMKRFAKKLCLPYIAIKRPDWDKFAGAHYTVGIEVLMPSGRTLQLASIHQYKDNFAKPYEITYEDDSGEHHHAHQTTYGMSERILGAVIGVHGDDGGLIFPPDVAPTQVVIVPILAKDTKERVEGECEALLASLKERGIRAHLDNRDLRPGNKYFHWEMMGVPVRIEMGMRDIDKGVAVVVRRDNREKTEVPLETIASRITETLDAISNSLLEAAEKSLEAGTTDIRVIDDLHHITGIGRGFWCGNEACGHRVEEETDFKVLGFEKESEKEASCSVCGNPAKLPVYFAKTY